MSLLLALDLDGTLLRRDGTVHPDDASAIRRLRATGVPVAIVTGRLYAGVRPIVEALDLDGVHICANGAHVIDAATHATIATNNLKEPLVSSILAALQDRELAICVMAGDELFLDEVSRPLDAFVRTWTPEVLYVDDVRTLPHWSDEQVGIVVVVGPSDAVRRAEAIVDTLPVDAMAFDLRGEPSQRGLLLHALGVSKGAGLRTLAAHHGIATYDIVAVGDWLNDLSLFREAGRSFAMGGAAPELVAIATDTLTAHTGHGGGVAEAIALVWGV